MHGVAEASISQIASDLIVESCDKAGMSNLLLARSGLTLDRLASFIAIADAGGLSAAAACDPVRQSQLSRQLKELEGFFGASLIERRRGLFRLTAAGRALLDIARPALTRLGDFQRRCEGEPTEVHLGAGESALVWLVTPRLKPLLDRHPGLAFTLHNLRSEDIAARLRDGRLDFGILRGTAVPAGCLALPANKADYALFVPRTAIPKAQPVTALQLLSRLPVASLEGSSSMSEALADWAAEQGLRLNVRVQCTSLLQAAAAVEHAGMAALLPVWAESALNPGRTTRVSLPALRTLNAPLRLVWSRRQAAIRPFLAGLAKDLASALAADVHQRPLPRNSTH